MAEANPSIAQQQAKPTRDGPLASFPKFRQFPAELQVKIWQEAQPSHGLYLTECIIDGRRTESGDTPWTAEMTFGLQHLDRSQWSPYFRDRIHTIKALMDVCEQSRHEVKQRFPQTLRIGGEDMHFHADKDVVFIDFNHVALDFRYNSLCPVFFAGGWNTVVRRIALESSIIEVEARGMSAFPIAGMLGRRCGMRWVAEIFEQVTGLKQLVLVRWCHFRYSLWMEASEDRKQELRQAWSAIYRSDLVKGSDRPELWFEVGLHSMEDAPHAFSEGLRLYIKDMNKHLSYAKYAKLEQVEMLDMYHVDPELRSMFRELDFA